jgi:hypothetical protein
MSGGACLLLFHGGAVAVPPAVAAVAPVAGDTAAAVAVAVAAVAVAAVAVAAVAAAAAAPVSKEDTCGSQESIQ